MHKTILTVAMMVTSLSSQAQHASPAVVDLTSNEIARLAESFDRTLTEGQAWARVKANSEALYLELRGQGETSKQAMHNLQRIALPGLEIGEFGQRGQEIRQYLAELTQYARRKDGLSETAAVAATALTMRDVLQSFVAIERPSQIHMAVTDSDGFAQLRRSESLYEGKKPRVVAAFTERLGSAQSQSCTVGTLNLSENVYFSVECRVKGKDTYPVATAKSECSINNDRMRSLRLILQSAPSEPATEVLVWCSFDPR